MTFFDFLSLKSDVPVPSKSNNQKIYLHKIIVRILRLIDENNRIRIQDPLVRGMDPRIRIRIHTKMLWIRNTAKYFVSSPDLYGNYWKHRPLLSFYFNQFCTKSTISAKVRFLLCVMVPIKIVSLFLQLVFSSEVGLGFVLRRLRILRISMI